MVDENVLLETGDSDDAENFAAVLGHPALTNYVHPNEQFEITNIDYSGDPPATLEISSGKAFVGYDGMMTTASGEERRQLMFTVEKDAETGVEIAAPDQTNYLYIDLNIGSNSAVWTVTSNATPPNKSALLVAELDVTDTDGDGAADEIDITYTNRGLNFNLPVEKDGETLATRQWVSDNTGTAPSFAGLNGYDLGGNTLTDSTGVFTINSEVNITGTLYQDADTVSPDNEADAHHEPHEHPGDVDAESSITDDQGNTIFDYTNEYIPTGLLQGVSADSVADAHHTPHEHPGDQQATSDIEDDQGNTIFDYANEYIPTGLLQDVSADSVADAHHTAHEHPGDQQATSDIEDNQGNTIFDYANQFIPKEVLESLDSSDIAGVSSDSDSDAHHSKTTPADTRPDDSTEFRVETRTSDPSDPADGRIWFRTDR